MYAILKHYKWSSFNIKTFYGEVECPNLENTIGFMPIFETKEEAIKWNGGKENGIIKVQYDV